MRAAFSACSAWQRAPCGAARANRAPNLLETRVSGMKPRGRPGSHQAGLVSEAWLAADDAGVCRKWAAVFLQSPQRHAS